MLYSTWMNTDWNQFFEQYKKLTQRPFHTQNTMEHTETQQPVQSDSLSLCLCLFGLDKFQAQMCFLFFVLCFLVNGFQDSTQSQACGCLFLLWTRIFVSLWALPILIHNVGNSFIFLVQDIGVKPLVLIHLNDVRAIPISCLRGLWFSASWTSFDLFGWRHVFPALRAKDPHWFFCTVWHTQICDQLSPWSIAHPPPRYTCTLQMKTAGSGWWSTPPTHPT